jgi:hypothetical protein
VDIFAHGLWAGAAATAANRKLKRPVRIGWAVFWGVFPDLFAFAIPMALLMWTRFSQGLAAMPARGQPRWSLAWQLYHVSHSLIIFGTVFGLVWLVTRRPALELLGWLLHILIDIPTHTARFFPTPFLWPVSSYYFSGIRWGERWFMLANYSALLIVYLLLWWTARRRKR